jgi:hypothetical protein
MFFMGNLLRTALGKYTPLKQKSRPLVKTVFPRPAIVLGTFWRMLQREVEVFTSMSNGELHLLDVLVSKDGKGGSSGLP